MVSGEPIDATDSIAAQYFEHSSARRTNTDAYIFQAIREHHPSENITIVPEGTCNLLGYAAAGKAFVLPVESGSTLPTTLKWRSYLPPSRRLDGGQGLLVDKVFFGEYKYAFEQHEFYFYLVDGRDGLSSYPEVRNQYIIGNENAIKDLITAVGRWSHELHDEVWVFNQGVWRKDPELYKSIQKASWDDVILEKEKKQTVIADINRFFDSRETYGELRVPWKRGLIFYGPPGNGKTISIKAMSHDLYGRKDPVPTLYVRSLTSYGGPEYSLGQIFAKARQQAPCLLVFEDLDSIVTDQVRSFFLNEVDGLSNNDGILMIGSTNHLERLDPGISKRPSRFDRKYLFGNPSLAERVQYCEFWKRKLRDNKEIEFPHKLCTAIASITDRFSFAYMQEAFVAALLEIAADATQGSSPSKQESVKREKGDSTGPSSNTSFPLSGAQFLIAIISPYVVCYVYTRVDHWLAYFLAICTVAILLAIHPDEKTDSQKPDGQAYGMYITEDDLENNILWIAIQKQVKILRAALGNESWDYWSLSSPDGSDQVTKKGSSADGAMARSHKRDSKQQAERNPGGVESVILLTIFIGVVACYVRFLVMLF